MQFTEGALFAVSALVGPRVAAAMPVRLRPEVKDRHGAIPRGPAAMTFVNWDELQERGRAAVLAFDGALELVGWAFDHLAKHSTVVSAFFAGGQDRGVKEEDRRILAERYQLVKTLPSKADISGFAAAGDY